MKKKKTTVRTERKSRAYFVTPNGNGVQARLLPSFVERNSIGRGDLVLEFMFDPNEHEPRPGDLIVRKAIVTD